MVFTGEHGCRGQETKLENGEVQVLVNMLRVLEGLAVELLQALHAVLLSPGGLCHLLLQVLLVVGELWDLEDVHLHLAVSMALLRAGQPAPEEPRAGP